MKLSKLKKIKGGNEETFVYNIVKKDINMDIYINENKFDKDDYTLIDNYIYRKKDDINKELNESVDLDDIYDMFFKNLFNETNKLLINDNIKKIIDNIYINFKELINNDAYYLFRILDNIIKDIYNKDFTKNKNLKFLKFNYNINYNINNTDNIRNSLKIFLILNIIIIIFKKYNNSNKYLFNLKYQSKNVYLLNIIYNVNNNFYEYNFLINLINNNTLQFTYTI